MLRDLSNLRKLQSWQSQALVPGCIWSPCSDCHCPVSMPGEQGHAQLGVHCLQGQTLLFSDYSGSILTVISQWAWSFWLLAWSLFSTSSDPPTL